MTATAFIDTNVLLYASSNAAADQEKRAIARRVLSQPEISFSAQVLQEFYSAAVTKKRLQMTQTTYAAITARSYHPGGVHIAVMDGSVHFVPESISPVVWRAAGTRAGQEAMLVPYQ